MYNEGHVLEKILEAREKRSRTQKELINIFKTTLVSFTLNIPGQEKNSSNFTKAHEIGIRLLEEKLRNLNINIVHKIVKSTIAGSEAFLAIDMDPMYIKKITVAIEEKNELGRLFDFDVFTLNGEQISRRQLGLPARKCLLCNENAKVCGRSKRHSIDDLLKKVHQVINAYH